MQKLHILADEQLRALPVLRRGVDDMEMTAQEAYKYWLARHSLSANYNDPHWDAEERHEHEAYVEAMRVALDALEDKMNGAEVIFKKGRKKYRSKNFVIYDIDFLLENLAREIFMLYQAKSDFDKPLLDFDEIRRMFVDYAPCEKCTNPDTYGEICVKCGACGRKFDDKGVLIDDQP